MWWLNIILNSLKIIRVNNNLLISKYSSILFGYLLNILKATFQNMTNFGADTPFILLAKIKVKEDKVHEYLELADKTDKAVEAAEPGMLHHTFDQDPEDPLSFVWSEAYKNDDAFIAHLANPAVGLYLQEHSKLADDFSVEVYGTVGEKCFEVMKGTGVAFKVFQSKLGYSRL